MMKIMGRAKFFLSIGLMLLLILGMSCKSIIEEGHKENVLLRFAIASDGHYGQLDTDFETNYDRLITHLNKEYADSGLDYVFILGDIIHNEPELMPMVKKKLDGLIMPYYAIRGNHDMVDPVQWERIWGYPDNYDFKEKNYAFVMASTSNEEGRYRCADVEWLWDRLGSYQAEKGIFVFMHITPKDWTGAGIDCLETRDCLEAHPNIVAVFNGHDHIEDGMKVWNGIPYYFDGHFGGSWGTSYPGYRIMEVKTDGSIRTHQYNMEVNPISNENLHHLGFLKVAKMQSLPSSTYDPGPMTLSDGQFGSLNFKDGKWFGFESEDLDWTLDLGSIQEPESMTISYLINMSSWIFPPKEVFIEVSQDGKIFERIDTQNFGVPEEVIPLSRKSILSDLGGRPVRYLRVKVINQGTCPDWHEGRNEKAWLFLDEIVIK